MRYILSIGENVRFANSKNLKTFNFNEKFISFENFKRNFASFLKSFIILKEIKKPSSKFLRDCVRNQLRLKLKLLKKISSIQKSEMKMEFLPFFSPIFQDFWHITYTCSLPRKKILFGGMRKNFKDISN